MGTVNVTTRGGACRTVEGRTGLTLMEIIRDNGFDELLAMCGGSCSCSTCHIHVDGDFLDLLPPMGQDEDELLDSSGHRVVGSRLACQIPFTPRLDGVAVTIAPEE